MWTVDKGVFLKNKSDYLNEDRRIIFNWLIFCSSVIDVMESRATTGTKPVIKMVGKRRLKWTVPNE